MDGWVLFNGKSICSAEDIDKQDVGITERIGESVGHSVVNRIHNITNADWDKIPEKRGKGAPPVFDYRYRLNNQIASDGKNIVQVENKGSSVVDNRKLTDSVRKHKSNINKKKEKIEKLEEKEQYPFPATLRYGVITVLDSREKGHARCFLTDPDPYDHENLPKNQRIINRVRFLYDWISFISPRSQLSSSIATRMSALEKLSDPYELDGVPLRKGNGERFGILPFDPISHQHCSFFAAKSRVTDGPSGGLTIQLSKKYMLFLGIREDLLFLASRQFFDNILDYKAESGSIMKSIDCIFSEKRFEFLILPDEIREGARESGNYRILRLNGQLHYSREGTVFGILKIS